MDGTIEVRDLHHQYPDGTHALHGIDVTVQPGEFVAIIGQNGSGKTTFVKHLNGLLKPTQGSVYVDGLDVAQRKVSEMAHHVGYCFQNPDHQIFCESVEEEVSYGPRNLKLPPEEIESRVSEALLAVGMDDLRDRHPRDLSKGLRQRLAVASVIAMHPAVLVVDEPTTGQDYQDGIEMLELIAKLNQEGHTIIFITHDMPMVARFAERVIVLRDGQVLLDGPTRDVFREVETLRTTFLAPPQITEIWYAFRELYPTTALSVREMVDQTLALLQRPSEEPVGRP